MSRPDALDVAFKAKYALTKAWIHYGAATVFTDAVLFTVPVGKFDRARMAVFGDMDTQTNGDGGQWSTCEGRIDGITVKIVAWTPVTR